MLTETSDLDDFLQLINRENEHYAITIKESRDNIKGKLQTLDDYLKTAKEKLRKIEDAVEQEFRRLMFEMSLSDETNTYLEGAVYYQKALKTAEQSLKEKKAGVLQEEKDLQVLEKYMKEQDVLLHQQILLARNKLHKGLTPERIQKFRKFEADVSLVGDQCAVCMDEFEVGREMMQLDCKGQHKFCQECVERWLANHNTCPVCREKFENVLV